VRALAEKRDRIVAALEEHFSADDVVATGASSGTHVFLRLPRVAAEDTDRLLELAREHGVQAYSALPYYHRAPRHAALILGYTTVAVDGIEPGVRRLAAAYRKMRGKE
jgi:DNA-binding transcriptional MocR family regulator